MEKYKHFDHKADVGYEAFGKSLNEAVENAAQAMFDIIGEGKENSEFEVEEKADSLDELIVYFLSACLTESEIHEIIPRKLLVTQIDEKSLTAKGIVYGDKHGKLKMVVKAVTFHGFEVKKDKKGVYTIKVILDI